jgi:hypothetical protein
MGVRIASAGADTPTDCFCARLVAQARHRERAHETRQAAAKRPPRAYAPYAQDRDNTPARYQLSTAADPLRCFPAGVQYRKASRGSRHEVPGRNLLNPEQGPTTVRQTLHTPSTTATSSSPPAAASACIERRSTYPPCLPANARPTSRGFVPWRVSYVGPRSAWLPL